MPSAKVDGEAKRPAPPGFIFVWDNFGPTHADRCDALARAVGDDTPVLGIELSGVSATYAWQAERGEAFQKVTLQSDGFEKISILQQAWRLLSEISKRKEYPVFFCHYEKPAIFFTALLLRMAGRKVYIMNDSKFDDYPRALWREVVKSFLHLPYCGALVSADRSADYVRFLGIPSNAIEMGYDSISISRIQNYFADDRSAPPRFEERNFLVVARLVPKKNLEVAVRAFAHFRFLCPLSSRRLVFCGSGSEQEHLERLCRELDLVEFVDFIGFKQTVEVCKLMSRSLALLLPSKEEQFGLVVAEAQAVGLPVLISMQCGAADRLVRTGSNGYVLEPDDVSGFARFMRDLAEDEALWTEKSAACALFHDAADVKSFAQAVIRLTHADA